MLTLPSSSLHCLHRGGTHVAGARFVHPRAPADAWHRAFSDLPREHGFEPLRVEGRLPDGLAARSTAPGPACSRRFGRRYAHWFDGDGAVSAFRFDGRGGASGAARLVQSRGLLEERRRGRPRYAAYGTPAPSLWRGLVSGLTRDIKNTGNTSVMIWQGRLYALVESSPPTELSTEDLATLGERDLDGAVVTSFSAHPHYVPARRAAYNFGVRYGRKVELDLYKLPDDGAGRAAGHDRARRRDHDPRLHRHRAPPRLLRAAPAPAHVPHALRPRQLLVEPALAPRGGHRDPRGPHRRAAPRCAASPCPPSTSGTSPPRSSAADEIVVDYVRYPDFASNRWLGEVVSGPAQSTLGGTLHRAVLDPARGTLVDEERAATVCEFPRVAASASDNRHVYAAAYASDAPDARHGMFDALARIDVARGATEIVPLGPGQYPSEPVFVRRPGGPPPTPTTAGSSRSSMTARGTKAASPSSTPAISPAGRSLRPGSITTSRLPSTAISRRPASLQYLIHLDLRRLPTIVSRLFSGYAL